VVDLASLIMGEVAWSATAEVGADGPGFAGKSRGGRSAGGALTANRSRVAVRRHEDAAGCGERVTATHWKDLSP
jgi:hypothetical protein